MNRPWEQRKSARASAVARCPYFGKVAKKSAGTGKKDWFPRPALLAGGKPALVGTGLPSQVKVARKCLRYGVSLPALEAEKQEPAEHQGERRHFVRLRQTNGGELNPEAGGRLAGPAQIVHNAESQRVDTRLKSTVDGERSPGTEVTGAGGRDHVPVELQHAAIVRRPLARNFFGLSSAGQVERLRVDVHTGRIGHSSIEIVGGDPPRGAVVSQPASRNSRSRLGYRDRLEGTSCRSANQLVGWIEKVITDCARVDHAASGSQRYGADTTDAADAGVGQFGITHWNRVSGRRQKGGDG